VGEPKIVYKHMGGDWIKNSDPILLIPL